MINKIEKLLDLCIKIAEVHLDGELKKTHPMPPFPAEIPEGQRTPVEAIQSAAEKAVAEEPAKKTRKPRAPKPQPETEEQAIADAAADQAKFAGDGSEGLEDQLGIEGAKPEMTEEESKAKMEEVTKQFVSLCKNDTPEDGKTRAIRLMRETFKVAKLGELTHAQRLEWIKAMEKGILEHK